MRVLSIFSGAGGLDIGFKEEGYKIIMAVEKDKDAAATYKKHSPETEVWCGDIQELKEEEIPGNIDVMLGGFPCQAFSRGGGMKAFEDKRGTLYREYIRILRVVKPKYFIGENVANLVKLQNGKIFQEIVEDFKEVGYKVQYTLINSKDYGVAQDRKRVIIVGTREDIEEERIEIPKGKKLVMGDILTEEYYKKVQIDEGKDCDQTGYSSRYTSRNRRRGYNEVSYTIIAGGRNQALAPCSPEMKCKVRGDKPEIGQKELWEIQEGSRKLSWQECAKIQGFPEGMGFVGNLESKYKQIGNAVPVEIGKLYARELKKRLK